MRTEIDKSIWAKPVLTHGVPTKWGWMVLHPSRLYMGEYIDIGAFTLLQAECSITLGDHVQIGGGCMIYSANTIDNMYGPVLIESGVKIGANSVIFPNVTIGKNTIIGAGSIIKSSICADVTYKQTRTTYVVHHDGR